MAAFPTVADLASAHIDSVNGIWKGLGYYSRASRLLDGAKTVVNSFAGKLPPDPDTLVKKIEGIGPYTAGAIASIAYGVRAPTVDGNVSAGRLGRRDLPPMTSSSAPPVTLMMMTDPPPFTPPFPCRSNA